MASVVSVVTLKGLDGNLMFLQIAQMTTVLNRHFQVLVGLYPYIFLFLLYKEKLRDSVRLIGITVSNFKQLKEKKNMNNSIKAQLKIDF